MNYIRNFAALVCYYIASIIYHVLLLITAALHMTSNLTALVLQIVSTPFDLIAGVVDRLMVKHSHDL